MSDIALPYPVLGRADDYIGVDFQATLRVDDIELVEGEFNVGLTKGARQVGSPQVLGSIFCPKGDQKQNQPTARPIACAGPATLFSTSTRTTTRRCRC